MSQCEISFFPPSGELETRAILKKIPTVHRLLAELKGVITSIPNESIIINTLSLQEAKILSFADI